jgi:tetratricopeptide (TPR) repeat protein
MTPTLALCMIVKDEVELLGRCLDSVRGLVDETVLVDTGSVDGTLELVKQRATTWAAIDWPHDFSKARNAALELVRSDWVLILDADEALRPGSAEAIVAALADRRTIGWRLPIHNHADGQVSVHYAMRLFRRLPDVRWSGIIHESVTESIAELVHRDPALRAGTLAEAGIDHVGYEPAIIAAREKKSRNHALLRRAVAEAPDDPFVHYDLARGLETGPEAEAALGQAGRLLLGWSVDALRRRPVAPALLTAAAMQWLAEGRLTEAAQASSLAQAHFADHPATRLVRGLVLEAQGLLIEALAEAEQALAVVAPPDSFNYDRQGHGVSAHLLLGRLCIHRGEARRAIEWLEAARRAYPDEGRLVHALAETLLGAGQPMPALRLAVEWMRSHPSDGRALALCAEAADRLGQADLARTWRAKLATLG